MHKLEKQVTGIINQFIIVIFRAGGPNERIRLATNVGVDAHDESRLVSF